MTKHLTIFFLYLAAGTVFSTQAFSQTKNNGGIATVKSPSAIPAGKAVSPQKSSSENDLLQDILFATNADCRIYINEEAKGVVAKDRFFYLKLPPGTYYYIAKNDKTGDEWRDSFTIVKGKATEVFIDMLYTIDAGNELRSEMNRLAATTGNNKSTNQGSAITDEANQKAIIQRIVADMIPIEGGTFVMGNNKSPSKDEAEHPVMVSPFFMNKYEVTQEQWEGIMGSNPSLHKGCPDCPVENVSWEEVLIFLRKINSVSNRQFRLPTEAEWEYVARMGGREEIESAGGTEAYIRKSAWAFINSDNKSHPVGKKQPNVAGIYDLFGNVSEWCMDWYGAFYFKEDFTEKDPEGPPLGKDKIIRGGNYKDHVGDRFRPSFRNKMNPKIKTSEIGFRLVMERKE
ncbi:MAG TPA: SUMF1/EgtB/PvdO family nonheme iron enzyme [Flavisolibacter sp.]|jgi:formylglycine-generating enzyme required for sulfatase activity|nr:SUMF1/EgtB/PvdO family nonheme iron enzyme [Flavisolibacter sp.]